VLLSVCENRLRCMAMAFKVNACLTLLPPKRGPDAMKSHTYSMRTAQRRAGSAPREDIASWFMKALGLLIVAIAMMALLALTGCKEAGKMGTGDTGAGSTPPPLSTPPSAPPPSAPPAEPPPSGTGMTTPAPMPSPSSSAPKP
jgi:hypothetical protein